MKTRTLILAAAAIFPTALHADDAKAKQEELEAKFKETMTAVVLAGHWSPLKDGVVGPEKEDKYTVVSVEKKGGDSWVVNAKLKYKQAEFSVPVPVQVKWAGDTAVIVVDKLTIPGYGGAAYSARLLIHENTYAGTWNGGDHGGLMSGVIKKDSAAAEKK